MLTIQGLSYRHPNKDLLFNDLNLNVNIGDKLALIGHNGSGKSTLLNIIAGIETPCAGTVKAETEPYYVPQLFGQYDQLTIAEALGVHEKLKALQEILDGNITEKNYDLLHDDWAIEERCKKAMHDWQLGNLDLSRKMGSLSGGQKTKVSLAGISLHRPRLILLDEPSNHLDISARAALYDFVRDTQQTLIIVSHDRKLLNLLPATCELNSDGITFYGGNYDFYKTQKGIASNALIQDIQDREKGLKKAIEKERKSIERQQKSDIRAKKNLGNAGLPKIVAGSWKNNAEKSSSKIKSVHAEKAGNIRQELQKLRSALPETDQMKFGFDTSKLRKGKNIFKAKGINFYYKDKEYLWENNLDLQILSGDRTAIKGANGSGKTTLVNVILGKLVPQTGTVSVAEYTSIYIDQDYCLMNKQLKVYEQAQQFNTKALQEHEIKIRLNRFLFTPEDWDKSCNTLSGGERMRLMLCCLNIRNQSPDIIVLDEPTNNLDLQNIEILTAAIHDYRGTLIVISHDDAFLKEINIQREIRL